MRTTVLVAALCSMSSAVLASGGTQWAYSGHEGPEYWGDLSKDYALCSTGKNQSPIDIKGVIEAEMKPISFDYKVGGSSVINNGHTIQINYDAGSSISLNGHSYELKQFHFHAPSENLIGSHSFPLEGHLVHADKKGNLAVVGVMFEEGAENSELAKAWAVMPTAEEKSAKPTTPLSADALLPNSRDYYRFNGSLTTPPCSEGVTWLMMKSSVKASSHQIEAFSEMMHHANNRPVQATNARPVLK